MEFDPTITLGSIITAMVTLGAVLGGLYKLMIAHNRAITEVSSVKNELHEMRQDVRHIAVHQATIANIHARLERIENRLERVEARA